ncbi:MAG: DUF6382 domain-containing protein [Clostridia bacterium]|nr:DUF6382 domain-containing protein [Clostridia bacterium]
MPDVTQNKYNYTYERNATASYLVAEIGKSEEVQEYQVEMIANNPTSGILPLYIRRKDQRVKLYYNITSKVPLTWILKRKKLNKNEFMGILCGVIKPIMEACNYFLKESSFILDENYIFVSPDLSGISLVYLPMPLAGDFQNNFKDFVLRFITSLADVEDSPSDNYLQCILVAVKQENFNIAGFDRFLKDMCLTQSPKTEGDVAKQESCEKNSSDFLMPPVNNPKMDLKEKGKKKMRNTIRAWRVLALILSQVAVVAVLIGLFTSGVLESISKEDATSIISGLALIVGAADFLIIRAILSGVNSGQKAGESSGGEYDTAVKKQSNRLKVNDFESKNKNSIENEVPFLHNKKDLNGRIINENRDNPVSDGKLTIPRKNSYETEFLSKHEEVYPYLQGTDSSTAEKIRLTKQQFIIGRLEGQVDYVCSNNAVGKMHAEILQRDGSCYIKDLNSKNGTFVNNERIESNKEYVLENNDKVSLANCDFIFIIP